MLRDVVLSEEKAPRRLSDPLWISIVWLLTMGIIAFTLPFFMPAPPPPTPISDAEWQLLLIGQVPPSFSDGRVRVRKTKFGQVECQLETCEIHGKEVNVMNLYHKNLEENLQTLLGFKLG